MTAYIDYDEGKAANLFLDFYANSANNLESKDIMYARLQDQEAYDKWHLAWYVSEILDIHDLRKSGKLNFSDIPRKEKNLIVFLLLEAFERPASLLELGCAMFEMIDGIEFAQKFFQSKGYNIKNNILDRTEFYSIEMSRMMRSGAERLHPTIPIGFFNNITELNRRFDLIYDRNVTSAAVNTVKELVDFMSQGEVGFHNLYVCKDETFNSMCMGRSLTYFHLDEIIQRLDKPLYHLFGRKCLGPGTENFDPALGRVVIEGFFLCADRNFAEHWFNKALSYPEVRIWFEEKGITLKLASEIW